MHSHPPTYPVPSHHAIAAGSSFLSRCHVVCTSPPVPRFPLSSQPLPPSCCWVTPARAAVASVPSTQPKPHHHQTRWNPNTQQKQSPAGGSGESTAHMPACHLITYLPVYSMTRATAFCISSLSYMFYCVPSMHFYHACCGCILSYFRS